MPTQALSPADLRSYLGMGRQAAKGTAVAPTHYVTFVDPLTFGHNPNLRDVREAGGGQVIARQVKDFLAPTMQFAEPMRPDAAGFLLALLLGGESAITGAGPFVRTLSPDPGIQWVTFERNIADDVVERMIDSAVTELILDYRKRSNGPELMITGSAQGIRPQDMASVPTVDSYEVERPFLRSDCAWTVDTSLTPLNVESCTISLTWQFDEAILADLVTRSSLVKLHLTGAVQLVQLFESVNEADAYYRTHYWDGAAAGTTPGEIVYDGDLVVTATYGAGAAERAVTITLPAINWGDAVLSEPDPNASEAVRLTRQGVVVVNPGGNPVEATITNNRATAYLA